LIGVLIVPDVVGFNPVVHDAAGEVVQVEYARRDRERASVPGPTGIVILFACHVRGLRMAFLAQTKRDKKTRVGRLPSSQRCVLCGIGGDAWKETPRNAKYRNLLHRCPASRPKCP
jgi:hypothetical protein